MNQPYDAVVVGARVAGASTAMLLARFGHRVLLVDRARFPSDKVSTHGLLSGGVIQLDRWGLLDRVAATGAPPAPTFDFTFGEVHVPTAIADRPGPDVLYAPRRHVLDQLLIDAAVEAGVDFRPETTFLDVTRDRDGRVDGVRLRDTARGDHEVRARHTIGADGIWSKVARAVDAPAYDERPGTRAFRYAYLTGVSGRGFESWFSADGVAGSFPTNDDAACVYVGVPTARRRGLATFDGYQRALAGVAPALAERVPRATAISRLYGSAGLPNFFRIPSGPGWALVGDAGYHKDATSAHGITDALRDAELLARALDASLADRSTEAAALLDYQRTRDRLSVELYDATCRLAASEGGLDGALVHSRRLGDAIDREAAFLLALPDVPVPVAGEPVAA